MADDDKKPRTKNPTYDVFRGVSASGDSVVDTWELVASAVAADNRRAAIIKAVSDQLNHTEGDEYGHFAVVRHGEFKVLTRSKKVEPQDVWS